MKKTTHPAGFTLLELLIVVMIFGLLLTGVGVNFSKMKGRAEFERMVNEIVAALQYTKTIAFTGEGIATTSSGASAILTTSSSQLSFTTFEDQNGNGIQDATDTEIKSIRALNNEAAINTMSGSAASGSLYANGSPFTTINLLFIRGTKEIIMRDGAGNQLIKASILFQSKLQDYQRTISIDSRSGLIYANSF